MSFQRRHLAGDRSRCLAHGYTAAFSKRWNLALKIPKPLFFPASFHFPDLDLIWVLLGALQWFFQFFQSSWNISFRHCSCYAFFFSYLRSSLKFRRIFSFYSVIISKYFVVLNNCYITDKCVLTFLVCICCKSLCSTNKIYIYN